MSQGLFFICLKAKIISTFHSAFSWQIITKIRSPTSVRDQSQASVSEASPQAEQTDWHSLSLLQTSPLEGEWSQLNRVRVCAAAVSALTLWSLWVYESEVLSSKSDHETLVDLVTEVRAGLFLLIRFLDLSWNLVAEQWMWYKDQLCMCKARKSMWTLWNHLDFCIKWFYNVKHGPKLILNVVQV